MIYPYSEGNLLQIPQRYNYTPFMGDAFILAWQVSREQARQRLPLPSLPLLTIYGEVGSEDSLTLLQVMCRALRMPVADAADQEILDYWLLRFLKKFEVSKRLYVGYEKLPPHTPLVGSDYLTVTPYLWLAECLLRAWQRQPAGYFLSGLLKLNDTLVSQISYLDAQQGEHLAWILMSEQQVVDELIVRMAL